MTYTFRKAVTSEAKPLIGLYSESGCGKTRSSLLLAKGFTGDMSKVGMIETESGRGEAYADDAEVGGYNVLSIREDFSPTSYGAAISAAEKAGLQCLIVDSASHEWEGVGGVLAMAAKNQEDGKKGPLVWQRPKMDHAREFMLRLTQTSIPLVVVCMRAKYPMEEAVVNGKKDWRRSPDLSPKQSEDILFEMFVHGWIDQKHAFHGTKYTLEVLRTVFVNGEPISTATGRRLAMWASGRSEKPAKPAPDNPVDQKSALPQADSDVPLPDSTGRPMPNDAADADPESSAAQMPEGVTQGKPADHAGQLPSAAAAGPFIKPSQWQIIKSMLDAADIPAEILFARMTISSEMEIPAANFDRCIAWIKAAQEKRSK